MNEEQAEIRHHIGRGGSFALRTVAGSVKLRGTDAQEAVVMARSPDGRAPRLTVERGDGMLAVELPRAGVSLFGRGFGSHDAEIDFEVEVPRTARVNISAVSAEISAEGLTGEQSYKAVSGDLRLTGVAGRVSARSVSGDVTVRDGGRLELEVTTTSGDVGAEAERLEQFHVRSVSGDVEARATLRPGPRHSVETVSGDLRLYSAGGVTVEPARALDIGRHGRRPIVIGDGAAHLLFRSMSGEERVSGSAGEAGHARHAEEVPQPPTGSAPPSADSGPNFVPATSEPRRPVADDAGPLAADRLAILRALERGEIDVEEATRRLEEVGADA